MTPLLRKKLTANALLLVLALAMVSGILSSSVVFLGYYHRLAVNQAQLAKRLEWNAQSGVEWLLAAKDSSELALKTWDLFGDGTDSVSVSKTQWGIFEVGSVRAFSGVSKSEKTFFMGWQPAQRPMPALYLADQGLPLSIGGATVIHGLCKLPAAGFKTVDVESERFSGEEMAGFNVGRSLSDLPIVNEALINYLMTLFETNPDLKSDEMELLSSHGQDTLKRPFTENTGMLYEKGIIELRNVYLGKLLIRSDSLVRITKNAILEDVIVVAPAIEVQAGFHGSVQLFASDSIRIGPDCTFHYPSAIGLIKKDFGATQSSILLGLKSRLEGVLLACQRVEDLERTLIKTAEDCVVAGQIYTDGYLELHGRVEGEVTCRKFILKTPSSVYENYLVDAVIDPSLLPRQYVGSALIPSRIASKQIVKWL
jgi:cytoskeletal protein CcmA (bactofilin family)